MNAANYQKFDIYDENHKNIIIAEDNPGDVEIFKIVCEKSNFPCSLYVFSNGEEILKFLDSEDVPDIDVILLDINMPKVNGLQTLESIKANDAYKNLPTIILTSSALNSDLSAAREFGANGYIIKPANFNIRELFNLIDFLKDDPDGFHEFADGKL